MKSNPQHLTIEPLATALPKCLTAFPAVLFQASLTASGALGCRFLCLDAQAELGLDPERLARDPAAFFERLHCADREALIGELRDAVPGREWTRVVAYRHGVTARWLSLQARTITGLADEVTWCGHIVDVTSTYNAQLALERTQRLLQAAQQQAGVGYWDFEIGTGKINWTPEVFQIHGWTRDMEPTYEEFRGLWPPEDLARLENAVEGAISRGEPYRLDLRIKRPGTGEIRYVDASGGPLRNPATGAIERLFGTVLDISVRKEAELALSAAKDAAEAATRAKSEFLATMSHEIRTPLNGVIAATSLLRNLYQDGPQREYCETIHRSGEALLAVVNDILDYSKIESGRLTLEQVPCSLDELFHGALSVVSAQLKAKKLGLLSELPERPQPPVIGDPARIRQVLLNLLSNAIKFTPEGWIRVAVEEKPCDPSRYRFRVVVEDSGVGIPATKLTQLFQRFSQAESSANRRFGGTGLGLAICKQLIEMMGGTIGVDSRIGEGSTFWIELELPIHNGVIDTPPAEPHALAPVRPLRILVAEDNRVNQRIARWVLEGAGHEVTIAENGAIAVERAREPFDMILMDCQMPEVDGYEATRMIRNFAGHRLPIIGLTANALPKDRAVCLRAGMDDYLAKPYRPEELLNCIARWAAGVPEAAPEPATVT